MRPWTRIAVIGLLLAVAGVDARAAGAEPIASTGELPRIPAPSPQEAMTAMQVRPGFRVELAAAEPDVVDPVAMAFDGRGRLFVLELREYNNDGSKPGRVRLLEDRDHDGRFERSTVFADHLQYPTALIPADGGVLVGASSDLLFLQDDDDDGVADRREVRLTGFGSGDSINSTVMSFNNLHWGFDNRIYGAASLNAGRVRRPDEPESAAIDLRGRDFSFDLRTFAVRRESGTAQWGMSFDDLGRRFVSSNHDPIRIFMYEERYAIRNPHFSLPNPLINVAAETDRYAPIFRISPEEPWRVVRTRWRATGMVTGPIEGGGRPSGYFTAACGITIYRGDAFPSSYRGNAFIAEPSGNLIHRKTVRSEGLLTVAERAADERNREFLASASLWFRPVALANAPDGALYVADMSREMLELGRAIPIGIGKFLEFASGHDRGRIYRIVPASFQRRPAPRLNLASPEELVALLDHANGWHRETAARLLYERQDRAAATALVRLAAGGVRPVARIRALHALASLGVLTPEVVRGALRDPSADVREQAVRVSEQLSPEQFHTIEAALLERVNDAEPRVRYQLAFTLGERPSAGKREALIALARRDADSEWMLAAVGSSLAAADAPPVFAALRDDPGLRGYAAGREFLRQLLLGVGAAAQRGEASGDIAAFLESAGDAEFGFSAVDAYARGLRRAGLTLAEVDGPGRLRRHVSEAARVAIDARERDARRLAAVELLGFGAGAEVVDVLVGLLAPAQPQRIQVAAIRVLGRLRDVDVAKPLLAHWPQFLPPQRAEALSVLLARPERVGVLLDAVAAKQLAVTDLSANQIDFLKAHDDAAIRVRAEEVLGRGRNRHRQSVIESYRHSLSLPADAQRGQAVYLRACSACHRAGQDGARVGPDLRVLKSSGKEVLLTSILDPNRDVAPNYLFYTVTTVDHESILGAIAEETATSVTLQQPFGAEVVVQRAKIAKLVRMDRSFMPEGLEAAIAPDEMADLLEFIATLP